MRNSKTACLPTKHSLTLVTLTQKKRFMDQLLCFLLQVNAGLMAKSLPPSLRGLMAARTNSNALAILSGALGPSRTVAAVAANSSEDEGSSLLRRTRTEDGRRIGNSVPGIRQPLLEQEGRNGLDSPKSL